MTITWETLVDSLRDEMQEYGGMVRLLEEQQTCLIRRQAGRLVQLADAITEAAQSAEQVRRQREQTVRAFAVAHGQSPDVPLRRLLPVLEADIRPLLLALLNEVNRLIHRTRQMTRQNHAMITRAVTLQQDFLRQVFPGRYTQTYSAKGAAVPAAGAVPAYRTAC